MSKIESFFSSLFETNATNGNRNGEKHSYIHALN